MAALGRWAQVDPLADQYAGYSPFNYVLGNPNSFIDPDGRQVAELATEGSGGGGDSFGGLAADTITVQTHKVAFGFHHASIRITPDNQDAWRDDPRFAGNVDENGNHYATLGAGPTKSVFPRLEGEPNRPTDLGPHAPGEIVDLGGMPEDTAINLLFSISAAYCDCLGYAVSGLIGHNSNSDVTGLLRAAGMTAEKPGVSVPGWSNPVREVYMPNHQPGFSFHRFWSR